MARVSYARNPQYDAIDSFTPHLIYVLTTKPHLIREASSSNQSFISAIRVLSPFPIPSSPTTKWVR